MGGRRARRRYLERADEFPRRREGEEVLLDHVRRARRLHIALFAAIGEPLEHEDPSDRLLPSLELRTNEAER